jgi:hypothetical protein
MKVQYNENDDELWCVECKERIHIGDKYIIVGERLYDDNIIPKEYHTECVPEMEDDD